MSAHREPDVVAEYAKNARMRGLRVIIAGAGISAALPGAVAAHTDLPVIGVPALGSPHRRRRPRRDPLDRADAARRAGRLRGPRQPPQRARSSPRRSSAGMIAATRGRSSGRLWTDEARMETGGGSRSPPARSCAAARRRRARARPSSRRSAPASFSVEAVNERERVTDHDVAAFVDVLGELRRRGRALDPLRPDLLRRARHRARAAAARGRRADPRRARGSSSRRSPRARASTPDTLCVGRTHGVHAEPTTLRGEARRLRLRGAPQRASGCERAFEQVAVGAISGAVGTYAADQPRVRGARARAARASRARTSPRRSSRATATPSC